MQATPHYPDSGAPAPIGAARLALVSIAVAAALSACGRNDVRPTPPAATTQATRTWTPVAPADPAAANAVLMRAISLVGTPYRYGGNTPEGGFDCSGLVNYVFRDMLDLRLPRTSRELFAFQGPKIQPERLATGDLVFFGSGGSVTHVGIYVGEGRFVHAPSTGGTVRLDHLDGSYWVRNYSGSKRVLH
ncbi:C40 family peptidase [Luteimonas terrae]|uniref:Peptidoglycan endopeptidase n=1 Tax=Luteimonas terrae TaxID=1530191 RepID=A0A4R5UCA6_9GAMM|nr:C40 family peptidase [Luteimonas terrae]TDK32650.1 peptidoglycan endopeptidase [Luteimonas terrae]